MSPESLPARSAITASRARSGPSRSGRLLALLIVCALPVAGVGLLARLAASPEYATALMARRSGARYLGKDGVILQRHMNDCGPAALAIILHEFGLVPDADVDDVALAVRLGPKGTSMRSLAEAAQHFGLTAEAWRLPAPLLGSLAPAILFVDGDHFVVARRRLSDGSIEVLDPGVGRLVYSPESLGRHWRGESLVFYRQGHRPSTLGRLEESLTRKEEP